jgi:hypothetical protein
MKLIRAFLTAFITLIAGETALTQQRPSGEAANRPDQPSAGWKLVWADEFEKDGRPDPRNWGYEAGFVRNRELQWYQPDSTIRIGPGSFTSGGWIGMRKPSGSMLTTLC